MLENWKPRSLVLLGAAIVIVIGVLGAGSFTIYVVTGNFNMNADASPGALETWAGNISHSSWVSAQAPKRRRSHSGE